jgi:small nuclear ribonucleoprotein (snRNP)-like protein
VATAYVKAFDVYMNMVLQDVQETYSVRLRHTVEDPKRPGRTRVKYALSSAEQAHEPGVSTWRAGGDGRRGEGRR